MISLVSQAPFAAKTLKQLGYKGRVFASYLDKNLVNASSGALHGTVSATFEAPKEEFIKRYEERYKTSIRVGSAPAYDALTMIAETINESKSSDIPQVASNLSQIIFSGVTGEIRFASDRKAIRRIVLQIVNQDGSIVPLNAPGKTSKSSW